MSKRSGSKKGSAFERQVCKRLSLWYTDGQRDDVFWRTSGSGARAKTRSKKSQKTFGQYGDVQANDPIGQRLIDDVTIEIKKGYNKYTFQDLFDGMKTQKPLMKDFINQAITDHSLAESNWWMLITKRDQREALVTIPQDLYKTIWECKFGIQKIFPMMKGKFKDGKIIRRFVTMQLEDFLICVPPHFFQGQP